MAMEYQTFEEASKKFNWNKRWNVFDKGRAGLNIAYECIDRHPENNIAIRLQNSDGTRESYAFGGMARWTSQFANMLEKKGINAGDRVAIVLNPSLEYYISFFGTLKRGAVAVPCYPLLGPDGIEYRLKTSDAKLAIIASDRRQIIPDDVVPDIMLAEDLLATIEKKETSYEPATSADTLAVVQFSSGTTGQPKQVFYDHSAVSVTAVFVKLWLGLKPGDKYMCTSSPAWGHGIWYGTVGPVIFGNGIGACTGKFDAFTLLEGLQAFEVNVLSAIPRVYKMIMDTGRVDDYDLKLKRLTYTGAAIETEVVQYFQDKLGLYIGSTYGNTEVGPIALDYAFDDWVPKLGSGGKPVIGVTLGILDDDGKELPTGEIGQVAVWRKEQWNPIGDYGYFDEDGYFWPKGRSDDVIKSSGYRIGPFEIENVLEKHPAVLQAAVVGSPHEERGEIVKAFVVPQADVEQTDDLIREIQFFVKNRLSMHEYPKEVEFTDSLPETPDGKLKRKELKIMEYEKKGVPLTK